MFDICIVGFMGKVMRYRIPRFRHVKHRLLTKFSTCSCQSTMEKKMPTSTTGAKYSDYRAITHFRNQLLTMISAAFLTGAGVMYLALSFAFLNVETFSGHYLTLMFVLFGLVFNALGWWRVISIVDCD